MINNIYPIFQGARSVLDNGWREYWYAQLKTDKIIKKDILNPEFQLLIAQTDIDLSAIKFGDKEYLEIDLDRFKSFLKKDNTPKIKYLANRRDCNAFSDIIKGKVRSIGNFLFADCWGYVDYVENHHAFNIFYASGEWYALEPQSHTIRAINCVKKITFSKF